MAGLALIRNAIEVEHRTQWLVPRLAAPDIQVPVQIEVFVAADARGPPGVRRAQRATSASDARGLSTGNCFLKRAIASSAASSSSAVEIDEVRVPVNQRRGAKRLASRIGKRDVVKTGRNGSDG
jgi:hypothetical protein